MSWRELSIGTAVPLRDIDVDLVRECHVRVSAPGEVPDLVAVVTGPDGRVSAAHDVVFYNQPASADGSVAWLSESADVQWIRVLPAMMAPGVARVALALAGGVLDESRETEIRVDLVDARGAVAASITVVGDGSCGAIEILDLDREGSGWAIRVVGREFAGLSGFLAANGVETEDAASPAADPAAPIATDHDVRSEPDTGDLDAYRRRLTVEIADLESTAQWRRSEIAALEQRLADLRQAIASAQTAR